MTKVKGDQSKISMVCDSYTHLEDVMLQNYIADNYIFPIVNAAVREEKLEEFIKTIEKKYPDTITTKVDFNVTSKFIYQEAEGKFFIELSTDAKNKTYLLNIYGTTYAIASDIYDLSKHYEPSAMGIYIEVDHYFLDGQGNMNTRKEFVEKSDIVDVSKMYYPYLDTDVLFKKYAISSESILLLAGQPGVGKTKLVALLQNYIFDNPGIFDFKKDTVSGEMYFKAAYIKNEEILARDTFWEELNKSKYTLIFLDDADNCLLPRDSEVYTSEDANRKKFISQLLSFTDGIDENKTKIIITTNRNIDNIDTAILRRGRTFDILEMQPLSYGEAKEIWEVSDLPSEEFDELFKDKHDIVPSELGAEIKLRIKMRDNDMEIGSYLLRDGISLLHSYRARKNKISF